MIPGRMTKLALTPTKAGIFRGACAEYCGMSHALMAFFVEVMPKEDFSRWLEDQASPAEAGFSATGARGADLFLANGCGACHTIRGTEARGQLGPDLTHLGSRYSIGAGILTNSPGALERWIEQPDKVKPGVHMPAFRMLPAADRTALAEYLKGLK